jgi:hypothetical protein
MLRGEAPCADKGGVADRFCAVRIVARWCAAKARRSRRRSRHVHGGTLRTIGKACDYMTNMGRQQRRVA